MQEEYKIDAELQQVMPSLTEEELEELEKSLLTDGYKGAPIIVWGDVIVDGHNRYQFCKKHNIPYEIQKIEFGSKEDAIQWMIRAQLGRRNLNTAQRCALVKKFRPMLEEQAKERQGKRNDLVKQDSNNFPPNLGESKPRKRHENEVVAQLAKEAHTGKETYRQAERVLDSGHEEIKEKMLSGEKSINASYKELQRLEKEGRFIEKPAIPDNTNRSIETNKDMIGKLNEVRERYAKALDVLQKDIVWLTEKEFFNIEGDDLTSEIRSELRNCNERLKELGRHISSMQEDDCGDDNVIIIKR